MDTKLGSNGLTGGDCHFGVYLSMCLCMCTCLSVFVEFVDEADNSIYIEEFIKSSFASLV